MNHEQPADAEGQHAIRVRQSRDREHRIQPDEGARPHRQDEQICGVKRCFLAPMLSALRAISTGSNALRPCMMSAATGKVSATQRGRLLMRINAQVRVRLLEMGAIGDRHVLYQSVRRRQEACSRARAI
jgi:hypothetical protein